jgi:aryl-alcohol dehydrogenase-like predicted oxidoreductase
MEKRKCGKSDIEVSILGIGCWSYGGDENSYWGNQEQSAVNEVVAAALDRGINYFDTAEGYNDGRSEEALGVALKGRRDEAVISTKISPNNTAPEVLREHCEASLKRLQTEYIDIYYVHWPITQHSVEDAFATLSDLKQAGKIRSISVSNFGILQLTEALATGAQIDLNQICYNLISRAIEVQIVPLCLKHNIGIIPYMPLMQGLLTGKYATVDEVPPNRRRTRHFRGDAEPARHGGPGAEAETFAVLAQLRKISAEEEIPMARLALAWTMARPAVTSVLVGARNLDQLQDNAAAAELKLDLELIHHLDDLTYPLLQKLGANADYWQSQENTRTR